MEAFVKTKTRRGLSATQILPLGFFAVITVGALLLHLPIASKSGEFTSLLDCFFTAVSATCVTGLVVVDTATHWSTFGHVVILVMIQIGGLGFMTIAALFSMLLRRHISPRERILLANSYNLTSFDGMLPLVRRVLVGTFSFEACGAVILACRFVPIFGWRRGVWRGVFHAVSAFCNAGFDLMGEYSGQFTSVTAFVHDPVVSITLALLIMLGGIGFIVWDDIYEWLRHGHPLEIYTRLVLIVSAILWIGGTAVYALEEWNNPATMGNLNTADKLVASFFQSVTMRTAGFNTISLSDMTPVSQTVSLVLMFIGGASGSTAGGVKVATFGLVFVSIWKFARGRRYITLFRRTVPTDDVIRAFSLCIIQFVLSLASALVLLDVGAPLMAALFETFSASGTVGSTLGLTPSLPPVAHVILMLLMYFGRVGILTIAMASHSRAIDEQNQLRYADVHLMIG